MDIVTLFLSPEHRLTLELNGIYIDPHSSSWSKEQWSHSSHCWGHNSRWVSKPTSRTHTFISTCCLRTLFIISSLSVPIRTLRLTFISIQHKPITFWAFSAFLIVVLINFFTIWQFCFYANWSFQLICIFTCCACNWISRWNGSIGTFSTVFILC